MNLTELQAAESKLLLQTYDRYPLMFVSGEGVHLRDEHGNDYLDLLSGIGVCALGYNHPAITAAISSSQAGALETSVWRYVAPIFDAKASPFSSAMSTMTTVAPRWRKCRASAAPWPWAAPVTMATRPVRSMVIPPCDLTPVASESRRARRRCPRGSSHGQMPRHWPG